jgi:hypothetical protein
LNIPKEVLQIFPYLGAGFFAFGLYTLSAILLARPTGKYRRLVAADEETALPATFGSDQHKIRLAFRRIHLHVAGKEKEARLIAYLVVALLGFLFMHIGLMMSPLISVLGTGLGYLLVNAFIEGSWKKVQMEIDSEIPLFLTGFASTVQVQQDKLTAVYEEASTLNADGALRKWLLERFVAEYERYGQSVFPDLVSEAFGISNSLGVMLYMIQRFWVAGGDWGQAFVMGTENLEGILDARIQGEAEGANARSSTLAIAVLLIAIIVVMTRNPSTAAVIRNPLVQIGYIALFAWMAFGWKMINSTVNEAF